jgi:alpha-glucosidase
VTTTPHLLDQPHHDGSELYVGSAAPALGDRVPVRLRVPAAGTERAVWVRAVHDGEPAWSRARLDRADLRERWYVADLTVHNPVTSYRWLLDEPGGYRWLDGRGVFSRDVADAADFRLTTHAAPPAWTSDAVVYQAFPDRFARSPAAGDRELPAWAEPADWDDDPEGHGPSTPVQLFGGDLAGVEEHLDHLERLGVTTLYLTPFFPSRSNHRYDATTFEHVDPLLGGDAALASLTAAVHRRGMRVLGDLTTNHTGSAHAWFRAAEADPGAPERALYYWGEYGDLPYATWLGVRTLPKLNWGADGLWGRMVDGPGSAVGRWLQPPYALDGWRVDVANMTGRLGADDRAHEVARRARATILAANPEGLLVSEHFHDAADDLTVGGWMSNMNYAAFTRPVWSWLVEPGTGLDFLGVPTAVPRRPAAAMVATMRELDSRYPWSTRVRLWNMLGSHDTARIRTVTGDAAVAEVAAALLFTSPGVPAYFMGDEGGFTGDNGESGRRTMPWDQVAAGGGSRWDARTQEVYAALAAARRSSRALRDGGMRWVVVADDAVAFLRETADERVLVVTARAPWAGARLPRWLAADVPELLCGGRAAATSGVALADDAVVLGGEGPAFGVWRLA